MSDVFWRCCSVDVCSCVRDCGTLDGLSNVFHVTLWHHWSGCASKSCRCILWDIMQHVEKAGVCMWLISIIVLQRGGDLWLCMLLYRCKGSCFLSATDSSMHLFHFNHVRPYPLSFVCPVTRTHIILPTCPLVCPAWYGGALCRWNPTHHIVDVLQNSDDNTQKWQPTLHTNYLEWQPISDDHSLTALHRNSHLVVFQIRSFIWTCRFVPIPQMAPLYIRIA